MGQARQAASHLVPLPLRWTEQELNYVFIIILLEFYMTLCIYFAFDFLYFV